MQRFCKEVITWKALHHPNVLPLLGVIMVDMHFAMVSEWMVNGSINQFIISHRDVNRFELVGFSFLSQPHSLLMATLLVQLQDVSKGLIYMHRQEMIHGDLKGVSLCKLELPFCLLTHLSSNRPTS